MCAPNVECRMRKKNIRRSSPVLFILFAITCLFFLYIHFRFINDGLQPITAFCDNTKIYVQMIYPSNLWILLQYFSLFEHFYNKIIKKIWFKYIIITIIIIIITFFVLQKKFYLSDNTLCGCQFATICHEHSWFNCREWRALIISFLQALEKRHLFLRNDTSDYFFQSS